MQQGDRDGYKLESDIAVDLVTNVHGQLGVRL
jgi:hypothetical protein